MEKNEINEKLKNMGFAVTFGSPFGEVRDNNWTCATWKTTVTYNERVVYKGPYSMGIGFIDKKILDRLERESWKISITPDESAVFNTWLWKGVSCRIKAEFLGAAASLAAKIAEKDNIMPDLSDVMYSLVSDSDVIDFVSFDDWANCVGYDTDSRKAEQIYTACMKIALALRNVCGESVMAELQTLFQDY